MICILDYIPYVCEEDDEKEGEGRQRKKGCDFRGTLSNLFIKP